jgi:carbonic anhydrase
MKRLVAAAVAALGCTLASAAGDHPGHGAEWSYQGATGPGEWARIKPEFGACAGRSNQSPVDIARTIDAALPALPMNYRSAATELVHNGHTLQANMGAGGTLTVDGVAFELKQFHFHSPSENRVSGESFPLEVHLVHADRDGNLAVLAVFFREGRPNATIGKLWSAMPTAAGTKNALPAGVSPVGLLPEKRDYYRYNGSLTTPPCSEGVRWIVMKQPLTVSKAQVEQFGKALGFANNRPIQPTNARPVLR